MEREQLNQMATFELVAYWNILQLSSRMLLVTDDPDLIPRHRTIVGELLTERNVPHRDGKTISIRKAA